MRYDALPLDLPPPPRLRAAASQPYDAFLVLDVEATCFQGTDFDYPNEIIEFPICLMTWQDKDSSLKASKLKVVDEFRSFVRPSWRPILSNFCTELTGITQDQVDAAPSFPDVIKSVRAFLVKNGLVDKSTGKRLVRFCWCSDGPFDVRDFVVKQCFISKIPMPDWITGDILDVRLTVMQWVHLQSLRDSSSGTTTRSIFPPVRRSLNIPAQLKALGLPTFQGRQHSGIDDTRNITKILEELGRQGVSLKANTSIKPGRKWAWMGKRGQILEQFCATFDEHGSLVTVPSPPLTHHNCTYPTSPHSGTSTSSTGSESDPNSDSSSASVFSLPSPAFRGGSGKIFGFGTATKPGSPSFWSPPRRPASPISIVSSSPESDSVGLSVRFAKSSRTHQGRKRIDFVRLV